MRTKSAGIGLALLLAIVLIAVGGGMLIAFEVKISGYVKTQAVIIDHKTDGNMFTDLEDLKYAEVVRYVTPKGIFTATSPTYSNSVKGVGEKIDIAYDPEEPSNCVFIRHNLFASILILSMGVATLLLVILIAILSRRAQNPNSKIEVHIGRF